MRKLKELGEYFARFGVSNMVIYVDIREPKEMLDLIRREEVPAEVKDLTWTDYLVCVGEYVIPVERKNAGDLVASIEDGRIFNQAYMMSTLSSVGYVVVEGSPSLALMESKFPRRAFIGALVSLGLKRSPYGYRGHVNVVVLDSMYDTALFLALLHKQSEKGDLDRLPVLRVKGKKMMDKKGVLIAMLQAIPGVGRERARRIAERFDSVEKLVNASVTEISSVEGVSLRLARVIKEYLT